MGKTQNLFKRLLNPDLVILEEEIFDEKGQLRLYNPLVQQAIFDLIQEPVLAMIKERKAEEKKSKKD